MPVSSALMTHTPPGGNFRFQSCSLQYLPLAAGALGMLAQLDRPITQGRSAAVTVSSHYVAETLLDIRG